MNTKLHVNQRLDDKLRWISRSIMLAVAILAVGCLFSITGCTVVKPVVGVGVAAGGAAVKTVGKTTTAAVGAVAGSDEDEGQEN